MVGLRLAVPRAGAERRGVAVGAFNGEDRLNAIEARLEHELQREFPAWRVRREESGGWIGVRLGVGIVVACSAFELQAKLRRLVWA
jgi:hypothetical protein